MFPVLDDVAVHDLVHLAQQESAHVVFVVLHHVLVENAINLFCREELRLVEVWEVQVELSVIVAEPDVLVQHTVFQVEVVNGLLLLCLVLGQGVQFQLP